MGMHVGSHCAYVGPDRGTSFLLVHILLLKFAYLYLKYKIEALIRIDILWNIFWDIVIYNAVVGNTNWNTS